MKSQYPAQFQATSEVLKPTAIGTMKAVYVASVVKTYKHHQLYTVSYGLMTGNPLRHHQDLSTAPTEWAMVTVLAINQRVLLEAT